MTKNDQDNKRTTNSTTKHPPCLEERGQKELQTFSLQRDPYHYTMIAIGHEIDDDDGDEFYLHHNNDDDFDGDGDDDDDNDDDNDDDDEVHLHHKVP